MREKLTHVRDLPDGVYPVVYHYRLVIKEGRKYLEQTIRPSVKGYYGGLTSSTEVR